MMIKIAILSLLGTVMAVEPPLVKTKFQFPKYLSAKCIKKDRKGSCLLYSLKPSDNVRYKLFVKSNGGNKAKDGNYTILVLASRQGFIEPIQVSFIKNVDEKSLKKGFIAEGSVSKELMLKDCKNFVDRVLLVPIVLNKSITHKEVDEMLKASRYCPEGAKSNVCSYSAFYAYVQKNGWVLNPVNQEFIVLCRSE